MSSYEIFVTNFSVRKKNYKTALTHKKSEAGKAIGYVHQANYCQNSGCNRDIDVKECYGSINEARLQINFRGKFQLT